MPDQRIAKNLSIFEQNIAKRNEQCIEVFKALKDRQRGIHGTSKVLAPMWAVPSMAVRTTRNMGQSSTSVPGDATNNEAQASGSAYRNEAQDAGYARHFSTGGNGSNGGGRQPPTSAEVFDPDGRRFQLDENGLIERVRIRKHEADVIEVPKFPDYNQLDQYKIKLQQRVSGASAFGDDADMQWLAEVWQQGVSLEDLQHTQKDMISIGRKLADELYKRCPAHVKMRIDEYNKHLSARGCLLNGRQVLWVMLDHFEFDDGLAGAKTITDLTKVEWLGDTFEHMTKFLQIWDHVIANMTDCHLTEQGYRDLLAVQIAKSTELSFEYKEFERAPAHDSRHSYAYLRAQLERAIHRLGEKKGIADKQKAHEKLVKGHTNDNLQLQSEVKAAQAAQKANLALSRAIKATPSAPPATLQQTPGTQMAVPPATGALAGAAVPPPPAPPPGAAVRSKSSVRREKIKAKIVAGVQAQYTAAGLVLPTTLQLQGAKAAAVPPANDNNQGTQVPKVKKWITDDGKELPWPSADDLATLKRCCYFYQFGLCKKPPEKCLEDNKRVHEKVPDHLNKYLKMRGKRCKSPRPQSAGGAKAPEQKPKKTRWAVWYCWDHADNPGSCTKTPGVDCRPHLTEEEAKEKAGGKVFEPRAKSLPRAKGAATNAGVSVLNGRSSTIVEIADVTEEWDAVYGAQAPNAK